MSLRLVSYNIYMGGAGREKLIARVINECAPDVVILQEAVQPDVVKRLASACSMKHWGALAGYSLAYLSRLEIEHHGWHRVRWARRAYLELVPARTNLKLFGVHLSGIHSNLLERRRAYELRSLLSNIAQQRAHFHAILGDFNTLAPGEQLDLQRLPRRLRTIVWMTGRRIRWLTIQSMLDAGYTDAYRFFHSDEEGFTFPTHNPHVRLDYAFVPARYATCLNACEIVQTIPAAGIASDHFPLVCDLAR